MSHTALIILAAGNSSRMGEPKQLLTIDGETLIRRAAETALTSVCDSVIVVLGSESGRIGDALAGLRVEIVENPDWAEGMGTSIHQGIGAAQSHDADGAILALADQPLVSATVLNKLVLANRATNRPIIASQYADTVGVPVYFAKEFFPHLLALRPAEGCKGLILTHPEQTIRIACPEAEADVDTPLDFQRISDEFVRRNG